MARSGRLSQTFDLGCFGDHPTSSGCIAPCRKSVPAEDALSEQLEAGEAICAASFGRSAATGPSTAITIRGDGHYGRPEAMDWCEDNGVCYVFGLSFDKAPSEGAILSPSGRS